MPAASLLQLMDVRKNCCDFLQSQLHPTNCLGIRAFADVHACTELLQQANAYAGEQSVLVIPPCDEFVVRHCQGLGPQSLHALIFTKSMSRASLLHCRVVTNCDAADVISSW